ncbi:hypothetical protein NQ314_013351 [Rhamnusium bicolor]|uniref:Uncharacterized protein n=1 Tax=Rhamnusium bicolor TaxID=1586634 RepID=A0AAV8X6Z6_9CUCU|nr:hypothetical protein NQ314_013351 [Rhamnusium bicolor]
MTDRKSCKNMASLGDGVSDIEVLRSEIERLTRELDQASSEKVQSAQYGLVLLEEKKNCSKNARNLKDCMKTRNMNLILHKR